MKERLKRNVVMPILIMHAMRFLSLVLVCSSCAGPSGQTESPTWPKADRDVEVRWCERYNDTSFRCATVLWPSDRFCDEQSCNGLCFETSRGRRCMQYERVEVADRPLAKPDPVGRCGVTCGDRDGDHRYERCIERLSCPTRKAEIGFASHYGVRHPRALYHALCAPLPPSVIAHLDEADSGAGDCDGAPLYWVISSETMRNASDASGPGLCYGIVEDEGGPTEKEECGEHHCQTLRYCDGREKARHCTVYAQCQGGRFVPVRLGW